MKDIPVIAVVLLALDIVLTSSVASFVFLENSAPNSFLSRATLYAGDATFYNQSGLKIDLGLGNSGTLSTSVTEVYVGTTLTNMQRLVVSPVYLLANSYETITVDYEWVSDVTYYFKADSSSGQAVVWPVKAPKEIEDIPCPSTFFKIVNPITNDSWFNFTPTNKPEDNVFTVNIEVVNVTSLSAWQFRLNWDPRLATFVNASVPEDVMLSENFFLLALDCSRPGRIIFGGAKSPNTSAFNGSCVLARVELKMTGSYGQSGLVFGGLGGDTFLLEYNGHDILFAPVNGIYAYSEGS
jgi:hypothetical protein